MKFLIFLSFVLFQTNVFAQIYPASEVGNGAIAIVCRDESEAIKSIELLDIFESQQILEDWQLAQHFKKDRAAVNILQDYLILLEGVAPQRAKAYQRELIQFGRTKTFVSGDHVLLSNTKDDFSPVQIDDENCRKETLISQINVPYGDVDSSEKYIINKDLFLNPLFPKSRRAVAILHELIYNELISEGWIGNSQPVRSYISFLVQETFVTALGNKTKETVARYIKKTREMGLNYAWWKGQKLHLNFYNKSNGIINNLLEFCPNNSLYRAYVAKDSGDSELTQWSCESGEVEFSGLKEGDLPLCEYSYCSTQGDYIVKDRSFRLRFDKNFKKKRVLKCEGDYPRLISYTCEKKEITPLGSQIELNVDKQDHKVLCQAEIYEGLWARLKFHVKCGR